MRLPGGATLADLPGAPNLPPLREVIATHGLAPLKRYGQHFLTDPRLIARIAAAAGDLTQGTVFEIGPGPGGLTRALLDADAARVVAVEYDPRALPALAEVAAAYPGRLDVVQADALDTDLTTLGDAPRKIVANLPYNISTVLLTRWIAQIDAFDGLTLMFQKEVAERLAAKPRTKAYGRLSVLTQVFCHIRKAFDLAPGAFHPPPKVASSVVVLTPKREPLPCKLATLEACTAAAFGQRRKTLRSSLKSWAGPPEALLARAELPSSVRAEELTPSEFVKLAAAFEASQ